MASLMLVNPRKRRRKKSKAVAVRARKNPRSRTRHHRIKARRNPRLSSALKRIGGSSVMATAKRGAVAGLGAVAADAIAYQLLSRIPVPVSMKNGILQNVMQAGIGIASGMVIAKFGSKAIGMSVAEGSVTVATYNAVKGLLKGQVPGLGEYDDLNGNSLLGNSLLGTDEYGNDDGQDQGDLDAYENVIPGMNAYDNAAFAEEW